MRFDASRDREPDRIIPAISSDRLAKELLPSFKPEAPARNAWEGIKDTVSKVKDWFKAGLSKVIRRSDIDSIRDTDLGSCNKVLLREMSSITEEITKAKEEKERDEMKAQMIEQQIRDTQELIRQQSATVDDREKTEDNDYKKKVIDGDTRIAKATAEFQSAKVDEMTKSKAYMNAIEFSRTVAGECRADQDEKPISKTKKAKRERNAKKKGKELMSDEEWASGAEGRKKAKARSVQSHKNKLLDECTYPIPWVKENEVMGIRALPKGCFSAPVKAEAKHAQVVAANGRLASVDFTKANAPDLMTSIIEDQKPKIRGAGQPPKHLGHTVFSKPLDENGGIQKWQPEEATRAARHWMVGVGIDPDRHDWVLVHHQSKKEEALHLLFSRVRDDGMIHESPHAFVASLVARARWDNYAGIDPGRIAAPDGKSKGVRDGFKALDDHTMFAQYRDLSGETPTETIKIMGRDHALRLAAEGAPDENSCAGTWTPKPAYRNKNEVRQIFIHVLKGD